MVQRTHGSLIDHESVKDSELPIKSDMDSEFNILPAAAAKINTHPAVLSPIKAKHTV